MSAAVLAVNILVPHSLLASFGPLGIAVVLFADTGLLAGFFLPGDSLLLSAGVLAAAPASAALHVPLLGVLAAAAVGAWVGAQVGHLIGRCAGPALFESEQRPRLRQGRERAEVYLARCGYPRVIVLARFAPVVRTVLNPVAGIVGVPGRTFASWQVLGVVLWSVGVTLTGYWLGSGIHHVDLYLSPIIALVVLVSLIPLAIEIVRSRRSDAGPA